MSRKLTYQSTLYAYQYIDKFRMRGWISAPTIIYWSLSQVMFPKCSYSPDSESTFSIKTRKRMITWFSRTLPRSTRQRTLLAVDRETEEEIVTLRSREYILEVEYDVHHVVYHIYVVIVITTDLLQLENWRREYFPNWSSARWDVSPTKESCCGVRPRNSIKQRIYL